MNRDQDTHIIMSEKLCSGKLNTANNPMTITIEQILKMVICSHTGEHSYVQQCG